MSLSNSEQLTWINEQYKPLFIKAFAFQKGEVIFLALLSLKCSFLDKMGFGCFWSVRFWTRWTRWDKNGFRVLLILRILSKWIDDVQ